jgi:hypothetical protein
MGGLFVLEAAPFLDAAHYGPPGAMQKADNLPT